MSHKFLEIGYIQGWNYICGVLIQHEIEEQQVYEAFTALMEVAQILYQDDFKKISNLNFQIEILMKAHIPRVFKKL